MANKREEWKVLVGAFSVVAATVLLPHTVRNPPVFRLEEFAVRIGYAGLTLVNLWLWRTAEDPWARGCTLFAGGYCAGLLAIRLLLC